MFAVVLVVFLLLSPLSTFAQGQVGAAITPAQVDEQLDPGQTEQFTVRVTNQSDIPQTFYLFTRDIRTVGAGGVPVFANPEDPPTGYELSQWISLGTTTLDLAAGGSSQVSFIVEVPEDASPGSHFAGIFVSADPPDLERSGAAIGFQVANTVHVRISGEAQLLAELREFSTDKYIYGSPAVTFTARIQNEGNVLVRPDGVLQITNMFGQEVGNIVFNQESRRAVFPGTENTFTEEWRDTGSGFGRYEAVLSAVYGDQGERKTISGTVTFWILPWAIVGPALGGLAILLLVTFLLARLYVQRTLAQYAPGRRINGRRRRRQGGSSAFVVVTVSMLVVTALFLLILLAIFA